MARHPAARSAKLAPLPHQPHPAPRNAVNAGNSCYLDAVLTALFADFDACDGLLAAPCSDSPAHRALHAALVAFVNNLRHGTSVPAHAVQAVRSALVQLGWHRGTGQHDAAELFSFLFDELRAPFVPLYNNLSHTAAPDAGDHAPSTERLLWLDIPSVEFSSLSPPNLSNMLDDYFFRQVRHGLRRRGAPYGVDATVTKSLIPSYTPVRETGETVSARRDRFRYLTVPLAINRFQAANDRKSRHFVHVSTAMPATDYVHPFAEGAQHTLILRSVVCHLGSSISAGHYIAYTFEPRVGWRRWNDLDSSPVPSVRGDVTTGMPEDDTWAEQIARDSYLLFYELVPGDGEMQLRGLPTLSRDRELQIMADAQFAAQKQAEEDRCGAWREQLLNGGGGGYFMHLLSNVE